MKEELPLISIIVPVYNVELYIETCIKSLIEQTYKNLEIIIIDDGSDDNSLNICKQYALKDKRIKLIHQKNSGVSAARNKGIGAAAGDYIGFVDADDYCDKNMFKYLYESLIKYEADIACCRRNEIKNNKIIDVTGYYYNEDEKVLTKLEMLSRYVQSMDYSVANKIYKKDIIKNYILPHDIIFGEDFFTVFKWLSCAEKIVYLKAPLYFRVNRNNSLTGSNENLQQKISCSLQQLKSFQKYINNYDKSIINNFNKRYMRSLYSLRCQLESTDTSSIIYDNLKNEIEKEICKFSDYKNVLSKSKKLKLFLLINFKPGYKIVVLWKNIFKRIDRFVRRFAK